jgi:uncharacterized protein
VKVVLDTNVFLSAVFFGGPPGQILQAWHDERVEIVLSPEILAEYQEAGEELAKRHPDVDLQPVLQIVAMRAEIVLPAPLGESVCVDPDDDKFLACAVASVAPFVVSGDKHLLNVREYRGVRVIRPREFVDQYLAR